MRWVMTISLVLVGGCLVPLDAGDNDGGGGGNGFGGGTAGGTAGGGTGGGGGSGGASGGSSGGAGGGSSSNCACRSGAYVVHEAQRFFGPWVITVADCGGPIVCTVNGQSRRCMDTADGVFRVYLDTLGYVQLIFSTESCFAAWTGVYASEGGSQQAITAHRAEGDAGVLCAGAQGPPCTPGQGCFDDPTDGCSSGAGGLQCGGWCLAIDGGTACAGYSCRPTELCKRQHAGVPTDAGPFEVGCLPATGSCSPMASCTSCFSSNPCPQTMCASVMIGPGARYVDCMGI